MTRSLQALPVLDGTRPATNARLAAWLDDDRTEVLDNALHDVKAHVKEAIGCISSLASAEECKNEQCTKANDVEYMGDELSKALKAAHEADAALAALEAAS